MKDIDTSDLSWDDYDELRSPRPDTCDFDAVVDRAISRRGFLGGALAFGSGAAVMGTGLLKSTTQQISTFTSPTATRGKRLCVGVIRCSRTRLLRIRPLAVWMCPCRIVCSVKTPTGWSCSI